MPPEPISSSIRYLPFSFVPITDVITFLGKGAPRSKGILLRDGHGCVPHRSCLPVVVGARAVGAQADGGILRRPPLDLRHGWAGAKLRARGLPRGHTGATRARSLD